MQTLLSPAARPTLPAAIRAVRPMAACHRRTYCRPSIPPLNTSPSPSSFGYPLLSVTSFRGERKVITFPPVASAPSSPSFPSDDPEQVKLAQVARRLEIIARYFKRVGSFGFWAQLICTIVSAVILSFSIIATGKITSPFTFCATTAGISAAFISVFWSFGYLRLSGRLRRNANNPSKAPPRADVVKSLKNGIVVNLLGMAAAILSMQATVGQLVAKALTSSATPYYQGVSPGYSPVLALDVFLVQVIFLFSKLVLMNQYLMPILSLMLTAVFTAEGVGYFLYVLQLLSSLL